MEEELGVACVNGRGESGYEGKVVGCVLLQGEMDGIGAAREGAVLW